MKYKPKQEDVYAYNSTWAGDSLRTDMLEKVLNVIEEEDLYNHSVKVGNRLFDELSKIDQIHNIRHLGGFGGFDVENRDEKIRKITRKWCYRNWLWKKHY